MNCLLQVHKVPLIGDFVSFTCKKTLDVDIAQKRISGTTVIKIKLKENSPEIAFGLITLYQVKSVWIDHIKVGFTHPKDMIILRDQHLLAPGWHDIKTEYSGIPPVAARPPWERGIQREKDYNKNPYVVFSCKDEGAKILFPCKDHQTNKTQSIPQCIILKAWCMSKSFLEWA